MRKECLENDTLTECIEGKKEAHLTSLYGWMAEEGIREIVRGQLLFTAAKEVAESHDYPHHIKENSDNKLFV